MEKYITLLKNSKLFQGIDGKEITSMLGCLSAVRRKYRKGEMVFRRGERIDSVALLLEGSIHIQKEDYWGNLSILNEIAEGEIFGEVYACLGSEEILNNAVAVKDSEVLFLDVKRILTMCPSACPFHGRLIRNLLSVLAWSICRKERPVRSCCLICRNSHSEPEARSLTSLLTGSSWRISCLWTGAPCLQNWEGCGMKGF